AKATMTGRRSPNAMEVPVAVDSRFEKIRIKDQENGSIEAELPALETSVSGQTTRETIPRRFRGALGFQVFDTTGGQQLTTAKPVSVDADVWKGLLDVPPQDVTFRGSMLSGTPFDSPVRFELSGRLSSLFPDVTANLKTETGISHFETMQGSAHIV